MATIALGGSGQCGGGTGGTGGNAITTADSYGQLGYTGGSVWTDPQRKLSVIFLTNRTNPTANTTAIRSVRPQLHDAVIRALSALLSAQNLSLDDGDWR
jgi:CubicO group peptidase (beta-lactamase class C family)